MICVSQKMRGDIMENIICFFETYNPIFEGIVYIFGIVGGIVGFIGFINGKAAKIKADECEKKINNFNMRIDAISSRVDNISNNVYGNNSQIAHTINNGLSNEEVRNLTEDCINEKTKYKPDLYYEDDDGKVIENPVIKIT